MVTCLPLGERSGFNAQSQQPEMTLGIIVHKQQKNAGDNESILDSKLVDRVIRSPKQRVPVAPQNGPRSNKNLFFKSFSEIVLRIDVCIDIYVMMSSDLSGTCTCGHCINGTSLV